MMVPLLNCSYNKLTLNQTCNNLEAYFIFFNTGIHPIPINKVKLWWRKLLVQLYSLYLTMLQSGNVGTR